MKEQAQLREEMAYQYKLGNFEVRKTCTHLMLYMYYGGYLYVVQY